MPDAVEAREAEQGKRMIEIRVRLWTNKIADGEGKIVPKHAWDAGVVRLNRNTVHGIATESPVPFNGFAELPAKIEKVLIEHGIKIHPSSRTRRYVVRD